MANSMGIMALDGSGIDQHSFDRLMVLHRGWLSGRYEGRKVEFFGCDMRGLVFTGVLRRLLFAGCDLRGSVFSDADLRETMFTNYADFSHRLKKEIYPGCDLRDTLFKDSVITKFAFCGSKQFDGWRMDNVAVVPKLTMNELGIPLEMAS